MHVVSQAMAYRLDSIFLSQEINQRDYNASNYIKNPNNPDNPERRLFKDERVDDDNQNPNQQQCDAREYRACLFHGESSMHRHLGVTGNCPRDNLTSHRHRP